MFAQIVVCTSHTHKDRSPCLSTSVMESRERFCALFIQPSEQMFMQ